MRASCVVYALWLVAAVGCDGPVLRAGVHLLELDSGEPSDARVRDGDAGRTRDAQQTDAEERPPWNPEGHPCVTSRQCLDTNEHSFICSRRGFCVECVSGGDCFSGRCNEELGLCKEPDKPRP
jgi:hypothetical protein